MDAVDEAIDKLLADRRRMQAELEDTKATADFWIRQAKRAEEAAADLQAELADTRQHWKEELAAERELAERLEQENADTYLARWSKAQERAIDAERELKAERALADRLAEAIQNHLELDQNIDATLDELNNAWECLQSSITAWKEARDGSR